MSEETKTNETPEVAEAKPAPAAQQGGNVPNAEQPTGAELNVSDLNSIKSIVDIATQRGAFKANELEAVGKTYNKLVAFLENIQKQAQAKQETQGSNNG